MLTYVLQKLHTCKSTETFIFTTLISNIILLLTPDI
jgi:hypothetical protein